MDGTMVVAVLLATSMMGGLSGHRLTALGIVLFAMIVSIQQKICEPVALLPLFTLAGLLEIWSRMTASQLRALVSCAAALLAVAVGMHVFPGFSTLVFETTRFGHATKDFVLAVGIDKWAIGAVILAYSPVLAFAGLAVNRKSGLQLAIAVPLLLIGLGIVLGVPVDIKFDSAVLTFMVLNLFVCAVEESFYRLLIQERFATVMPAVAAIAITGLIFFLTHFSLMAATSTWVIFATAGLLYACCYQLTRSLRVSIGVHWVSNALHVILLQYPLG